jgi:hypothetical protein
MNQTSKVVDQDINLQLMMANQQVEFLPKDILIAQVDVLERGVFQKKKHFKKYFSKGEVI